MTAHAQKPDFVFRRNGQVHLNWRGRQFSRLLAAEVWASAVVMLNTPRSEVVLEYWLLTPFASFLFTSPPVRHCVPSGFKRTLPNTQEAGSGLVRKFWPPDPQTVQSAGSRYSDCGIPARDSAEESVAIRQRFSNFFQVGTTFISQNVLRTTLLLALSNSLGLP